MGRLAATQYSLDLVSDEIGTLKSGLDARGYTFRLESGKPIRLAGLGLNVAPRLI